MERLEVFDVEREGWVSSQLLSWNNKQFGHQECCVYSILNTSNIISYINSNNTYWGLYLTFMIIFLPILYFLLGNNNWSLNLYIIEYQLNTLLSLLLMDRWIECDRNGNNFWWMRLEFPLGCDSVLVTAVRTWLRLHKTEDNISSQTFKKIWANREYDTVDSVDMKSMKRWNSYLVTVVC